MSWTRVENVRNAFSKRWQRGDILRAALDQEAGVRLHMALKGPGPRELSERFVEARAWIDEWRAFAFGHVEWVEKRDRVVGPQQLPAVVRFDSVEQVADWLGHSAEVRALREMAVLAQARRPSAAQWLLHRPFQALAIADEWPLLLAVAAWFDENPQSGLYARQVDVPGVHTKLIERHTPMLREWLGVRASPDIDPALGLRRKPARLRFRVLDPELAILPGAVCPDVAVDAVNFAQLELPIVEVFVTENEINYLAFPQRSAAIVIFGAGYGWSSLANAHWLQRCRLYYWGDIDTHGFAILDGFRVYFPHAESFLMDRQTLMDHVASWGVEAEPSMRELSRLCVEEAALYDDLRFRRLAGPSEEHEPKSLRFEQERVGYGYLMAALANLRT